MDGFSLRIKQIRKHLGKTQAVFAKDLGVPASTIAKYETGVIRPGAEFLSKIASNYTDLSMSWVLTGNGDVFLSAKKKSKGLKLYDREGDDPFSRELDKALGWDKKREAEKQAREEADLESQIDLANIAFLNRLNELVFEAKSLEQTIQRIENFKATEVASADLIKSMESLVDLLRNLKRELESQK